MRYPNGEKIGTKVCPDKNFNLRTRIRSGHRDMGVCPDVSRFELSHCTIRKWFVPIRPGVQSAKRSTPRVRSVGSGLTLSLYRVTMSRCPDVPQ